MTRLIGNTCGLAATALHSPIMTDMTHSMACHPHPTMRAGGEGQLLLLRPPTLILLQLLLLLLRAYDFWACRRCITASHPSGPGAAATATATAYCLPPLHRAAAAATATISYSAAAATAITSHPSRPQAATAFTSHPSVGLRPAAAAESPPQSPAAQPAAVQHMRSWYCTTTTKEALHPLPIP